jgi:hypothetical protein
MADNDGGGSDGGGGGGGGETHEGMMMQLLEELGLGVMEADAQTELPLSHQATLAQTDIDTCLRVLTALHAGDDDIHKTAYRAIRTTIISIFTDKLGSKLFEGQNLNDYLKTQVVCSPSHCLNFSTVECRF